MMDTLDLIFAWLAIAMIILFMFIILGSVADWIDRKFPW